MVILLMPLKPSHCSVIAQTAKAYGRNVLVQCPGNKIDIVGMKFPVSLECRAALRSSGAKSNVVPLKTRCTARALGFKHCNTPPPRLPIPLTKLIHSYPPLPLPPSPSPPPLPTSTSTSTSSATSITSVTVNFFASSARLRRGFNHSRT